MFLVLPRFVDAPTRHFENDDDDLEALPVRDGFSSRLKLLVQVLIDLVYELDRLRVGVDALAAPPAAALGVDGVGALGEALPAEGAAVLVHEALHVLLVQLSVGWVHVLRLAHGRDRLEHLRLFERHRLFFLHEQVAELVGIEVVLQFAPEDLRQV